jgi:predicted ATPase with chaperone activity
VKFGKLGFWFENNQLFYTLLCSGLAAIKQFHLTTRAFHRVLKLAQTIADLNTADIIKAKHLAEALQYRQRSER